MRELAVTMREFCINSDTEGSLWLLKKDKEDDVCIQACQPLGPFGPWENHSTSALGSHFWAHEEGDLEWPTWIYQKINHA